MQEKEYQSIFNKTLAKIMTLLEVSGNEHLKREVKSALYDMSDGVREIFTTGERANGQERNYKE